MPKTAERASDVTGYARSLDDNKAHNFQGPEGRGPQFFAAESCQHASQLPDWVGSFGDKQAQDLGGRSEIVKEQFARSLRG